VKSKPERFTPPKKVVTGVPDDAGAVAVPVVVDGAVVGAVVGAEDPGKHWE
jgi:hypothetical protein